MNKAGEAGNDIGKEGGILQTAIQKYVDKKDSDKERKKKAAWKAKETMCACVRVHVLNFLPYQLIMRP